MRHVVHGSCRSGSPKISQQELNISSGQCKIGTIPMRDNRPFATARYYLRKRLAAARQAEAVREYRQAEEDSFMETQRTVYLPLSKVKLTTTRYTDEDGKWKGGECCTFILMQDSPIYFYECTHCSRARIQSFGEKGKGYPAEIPVDVFEEMKLHAELCEKIER
jgi:hypothetical protein